jgi:deoxycitidine kinase/deoxyguanosine kinase
MRPNVVYFFVEGNIGATKTTLLDRAATRLCRVTSKATLVVVPEPIDEWNIVLSDFYKDPRRWAFTFQIRAMSTRIAAIRAAIEHAYNPDEPERLLVVLCERSIFADRHIFVEALYNDGMLTDTEYVMYADAWTYFSTHAYPGRVGGVIYLDTEPVACLTRIRRRARDAESTISLEYLTSLDALHEVALKTPGAWSNAPVLRIDVEQLGNVPRDEAAADALAEQIDNFMCLHIA